MRWRYQRFFSTLKRPPWLARDPTSRRVEYLSELDVTLSAMRVVWLQQWIVGAFDYLDDSVLAAVLRHGQSAASMAPRLATISSSDCI